MSRFSILASSVCCTAFTACLFWEDTPTSPQPTGPIEWRGSVVMPTGIEDAVFFLQKIVEAERRQLEAFQACERLTAEAAARAGCKAWGLDLQYRRREVDRVERVEIGIPGEKETEWLALRGTLLSPSTYSLLNWDRVADCFVFVSDWYESSAPAVVAYREEFLLNRGWSYPERAGQIVCGPVWVSPVDPATGLPMRWQKVLPKPEP